MKNNNITDSNVATGNNAGGDFNQHNVKGNQTYVEGNQHNVKGNQTYVEGNQHNVKGNQTYIKGNQHNNTSIKNTGIMGCLGTVILIVILGIIIMFFLGIDKKDIEKWFNSGSALDNRQKILMSIRGTYLDEQNNELVFSPKSVSGMDGSVSIQGRVIFYYKLISENSIYMGGQFSRDGYIGMPFTLTDSKLQLFTGEGDEFRTFTKINGNY